MTNRILRANRMNRALAFGSTALVLALIAQQGFAQTIRCDEVLVPQPENCRRANADIVVDMPLGENAEAIDTAPGAGFGDLGFSISIDGDTVAGAPAPAEPQREADLAAAAAEVDVRYDGLDLRRTLNVSTSDLRAAYRAGEQVTFRSSANYPAFIARAELRIIDRAARGRPVIAVLPAKANGELAWTMPEEGSGDLAYVLRVYDSAGRYDETAPLELTRTDRAFDTHDTTGQVIAAGEGEDRSRIRNIPLRGGRIVAAGTGAVPGGTVRVMGEDVPADGSGAFVVSRIVPAGDHVVEVDLNGRRILRDVTVPDSEWFYVGIADITAGHRLRDDLASADPDYEKNYLEGRLAGYAKGKTQRGYTITGSVDTGEGDLKDVFRRLNDKDPRKVLQRLDENDYYPTYGDDSSAFDDAPTSGRVYLKIEREGSSLTWGDFKADVTGAELLRNTRALYGAELRYNSPSVTEHGEVRTRATLYAAQPDTLPQRDILRGTGGSVYFLSRQDINGGSETVTVDVVDPITGRVVSRTTLTEGVDYDIDYIQGVIVLSKPLQSSASGGGIIGSGTGSLDVNLVVSYEYTPTLGNLDGMAYGGRAEGWVTERLRLGVTAMSETTGTADQKLAGADLRYEIGERSYVEAEIAHSDGPGFGRSLSSDGGLTITPSGVVGATGATAFRFDSRFELTDLGLKRQGFVGVYAERKGAGFSTLTEDITNDQNLVGMNSEIGLTERLTFGLDAEDFREDGGDKRTKGEVRLAYRIDERWKVTGAIAHLDKVTLSDPTETGKRTDAAVRLDYRYSDDLALYGLGQVTLAESGGLGDNHRLGFGFDAQLSEKLSAQGEISGGSKGRGTLVRLSYTPTADNEVYVGYTLDPTRTGAGYSLVGRDDGVIVVGGRYRYSEAVSTYGENNWDLFGERRSLTRTYGVTYTPNARWTLSGSIESGQVRDSINGDFDRDAVSFGLAYTTEGTSGRARLEYRIENGIGTAQDRKTWAATGGYEYKINPDWRFLANLDALISKADSGSFLDGEYVEASLGYAYRPVLNDRLNLLARYTYLRDLPGADQVSVNGTVNGDVQVSHIFSIDGNFDLSPKLTLGGKYGFRQSRVAPRGTSVFNNQTAHLGIVRLDWHVVHKWDVMGEARMLYTEQSDITETGALLALYRHVGNNAKVGVGYECGRVSDNPAAIDYVGKGVFLNLIAKF
ncbi:hypothetical protein DEA8626_00550 [Defluviimonas aquaemixtae]|uniref:Flagellar motor protein MotB n=1 Tax=Albidovulum aquaemixtae TaxID=1542388 RepID=A0A2R8B330_9RHOB|nr:hypothetical protein [Defluviimonas aquaemixtae]SPH17036.1 hypothetical protein DEA8626_00550 [Defluviimonas aquaemixtae]